MEATPESQENQKKRKQTDEALAQRMKCAIRAGNLLQVQVLCEEGLSTTLCRYSDILLMSPVVFALSVYNSASRYGLRAEQVQAIIVTLLHYDPAIVFCGQHAKSSEPPAGFLCAAETLRPRLSDIEFLKLTWQTWINSVKNALYPFIFPWSLFELVTQYIQQPDYLLNNNFQF